MRSLLAADLTVGRLLLMIHWTALKALNRPSALIWGVGDGGWGVGESPETWRQRRGSGWSCALGSRRVPHKPRAWRSVRGSRAEGPRGRPGRAHGCAARFPQRHPSLSSAREQPARGAVPADTPR